MKRVLIVVFVVLVLLLVGVLVYTNFFGPLESLTGGCVYNSDPNVSKAFESVLQEEIANIPQKELYYTVFEDKILLSRNKDECGYYFTSSSAGVSPDSKMYINREIIIGFNSKDNSQTLNKIITEQSLNLESELLSGDAYVVTTTSNSKYQNALQMSQYINQEYSQFIKYAEPNFTSLLTRDI